MIRNLLFDWSGTLADDLPAVLTATNGLLAELGKPAMDRAAFRERFRLPLSEFYQEVTPGITEEQLRRLYLKHFPTEMPVPAIEGAATLLEHALATGRRMVVLSSAPGEHVEAQARALGWHGFFEQFHCGVADKRETLPDLLTELDMLPEETAFIGDMRHDVDAAKAAGVLSVAVSTGYESAQRLLEAAPDLLVNSLADLPLWMGQGRATTECHPIPTVGALVRDAAGHLLMIQTHKWKDKWGIPGGKIRRGEASLDALRRELLEETGLEIRNPRFVVVQDCVEPEEFQRSAHFLLLNYVAEVAEFRPTVHLNEEAEAYRWVTPGQAGDLDLNIPTRVLLDLCREQGMLDVDGLS